MANGKIRFGKQSGGKLALVFPDGVTDTEVLLPESGELATKKYVDDNTFNPQPIIHTGTTTFTATTNNISLTNIVTVLGVEIGDVIQISGANDAKNNSEFTVEVIIDNNNIIVNQAHANKGTSKNVAARVGDTGVTVKLLAKWYNAPVGLGQGWVSVKTIRAVSTVYVNNTNRTISVSILSNSGSYANSASNVVLRVNVYNFANSSVYSADYPSSSVYANISKNDTYKVDVLQGSVSTDWLELR